MFYGTLVAFLSSLPLMNLLLYLSKVDTDELGAWCWRLRLALLNSGLDDVSTRGILTSFLTVFDFLWTWPSALEERRNKAGSITHRTLAFGIQQIIKLFGDCFATSSTRLSWLSPTLTFVREKLAAAGFFDMDVNSIPGLTAPLKTSNARSLRAVHSARFGDAVGSILRTGG